MPEYGKMKNADLEALLKERGLPTGGKKADMVDRLNKDDENKKAIDAKDGTKPTVAHPEDEIDWDDDEDVPAAADSAKSAEPTNEAAIAVEKAGGEGAIDNPQAVPNQVADIDPSTTADLSVKAPGEEAEGAGTDTQATGEKTEPAPDYTRGLAASNLDQEIEKRKARAKKFGLNIEEDEGLKKLERAKKFGETGPPKGLDEALPERSRKRGRETNDSEGARGRDKRRGGFGGRRGRGNDDRRRDDRGPRDSRREEGRRENGGASGWMNEADKAKAEARKAKFANSSAAA